MADYLNHTVKADEAGWRFDRWVKKYYPGTPHALLHKLCRRKAIRLDGEKLTPEQRLQQGQMISLPASFGTLQQDVRPKRTTAESIQSIRDALEEMTLYQDANLWVLNKPAGLAVQGGSGIKQSVDAWVAALNENYRLVHRLDKDTSGLLLIAKNRQTASALTFAFQQHQVQKTYLAVTVGVPQPMEATITAPLSKLNAGKGQERMVVDEKGQKAMTDYEVVDWSEPFALVKLSPQTGRTHQLRVHMAYLETPILGDGKYGGQAAFTDELPEAKQLHLHAWKLTFNLPEVGKRSFEAPLPPHMQETLHCTGLSL